MPTVRPIHSAHDDQPRSLHNKIKCLSKTTFLSGSKSYRLVSTFVRSRHRALTMRPCHQALTTINIDHYTNTLDEACHQAFTVRPANDHSQLSASLEKLFLHHEYNTEIINIIQKGYHYHLDLIPTKTDIDRKVGGTRGGPVKTLPPPIR